MHILDIRMFIASISMLVIHRIDKKERKGQKIAELTPCPNDYKNDQIVEKKIYRVYFIARNRGHFASVINCQRHLFFKMADKNNRSQGKRFPYDILNNLSSLDLFYEVYIP